MAKLILTDAEKAAAKWIDLDDENLGRVVKHACAVCATVAEEQDKITEIACALMLVLSCVESNAEIGTFALEGVTHKGKPVGDWVVQCVGSKRSPRRRRRGRGGGMRELQPQAPAGEPL